MQEEVENRTLNLAISTTKLSGRTLLAAFRKYRQHRRNVKAKKLAAENEKPVGEQTIDQLLGQNQGATNIEIEKTEALRGFWTSMALIMPLRKIRPRRRPGIWYFSKPGTETP